MALDKDNHNSAWKPKIEKLNKSRTFGVNSNNTPKSHQKVKFDFSQADGVNEQNLGRINTTTVHTRMDSGGSHSKYFEGSNEFVIIHNSKVVSPIQKVKLKWNEAFMLKYSPNADALSKLFSISLFEQDKLDSKIVGSDRTFSVDQFDSAKIYDLNIDFKKSYKEKTEARISIKLQYIKDLKSSLNQAVSSHKLEKKKLYLLFKLVSERINTLKSIPNFDPNITQNGGWYDSDDQWYKKTRTHRRCAEIEHRSNLYIEVEDRSMSLWLTKSQNPKMISDLGNSDKNIYKLSSSFVKNQDSSILNSSMIDGSVAGDPEGKSSILVKDWENGKIDPGSYLNYL